MKRTIQILSFSLILLFCLALSRATMAQAPPPPPSEKGTSSNHAPTGAPIDPGTGIFMVLAAVYGLKKVHGINRKK